MSDVTITDKFVLFWAGWPSQWFKCRFSLGGIAYNCCEQFMMAEKARVFGDDESLTAILKTSNPRQQKALGRDVKRFDAELRNSVCRGIVYRANLAKFSQNADLQKLLLDTEERTIVEASPLIASGGLVLPPTIRVPMSRRNGKARTGSASHSCRRATRFAASTARAYAILIRSFEHNSTGVKRFK